MQTDGALRARACSASPSKMPLATLPQNRLSIGLIETRAPRTCQPNLCLTRLKESRQAAKTPRFANGALLRKSHNPKTLRLRGFAALSQSRWFRFRPRPYKAKRDETNARPKPGEGSARHLPRWGGGSKALLAMHPRLRREKR